jgi:DNA-binding NarL/FixJ family response regulator
MDNVRVAIFAPDPLARTGLFTLLADEPDVEIVAQVSDEVLLYDGDETPPDVILWDLGWEPPEDLPDLSGGDAPVLALLASADDVPAARESGASGFLHRGGDAGQLAAGLRAVASGLLVFEPQFAAPGVLRVPPDDSEEEVEPLTPREMEVLQLLAQGVTNRAIGYELQISEYTVKFHVNSIMRKLAAQSRTEAVVRATRLGLIVL